MVLRRGRETPCSVAGAVVIYPSRQAKSRNLAEQTPHGLPRAENFPPGDVLNQMRGRVKALVFIGGKVAFELASDVKAMLKPALFNSVGFFF